MTFGIDMKARGHEVWWGARAILSNGYVDVVWDRCQMVGGTDAERSALARWIDKVGMPAIRKLAKAMTGDQDFEERFEQGGYFIVANPKRSHGYLYIGAAKLVKEEG